MCRAVEGLAVDGVIVLKGVVDKEHARLLHERVLSDVRDVGASGQAD